MYALNLPDLLFVSLMRPFQLTFMTGLSCFQFFPAILQFLLQSVDLRFVVPGELLEVLMLAL